MKILWNDRARSCFRVLQSKPVNIQILYDHNLLTIVLFLFVFSGAWAFNVPAGMLEGFRE